MSRTGREPGEDFQANLAKLRDLAPVTTICMHGSPLSRINNLDLWQTHDYKGVGSGFPYCRYCKGRNNDNKKSPTP